MGISGNSDVASVACGDVASVGQPVVALEWVSYLSSGLQESLEQKDCRKMSKKTLSTAVFKTCFSMKTRFQKYHPSLEIPQKRRFCRSQLASPTAL